MKFVSIFVGLAALFVSVFVYKVQVESSPELPMGVRVFMIAYNAIQYVGDIAEDLGYTGIRLSIVRGMADYLAYLQKPVFDKYAIIEDAEVSGIPVKIYRPRNVTKEKLLPGLLHFHGGGLIALNINTSYFRNFCSRFAHATNSIVISVGYRKAPEHVFPAQFDDCYAVTKAVIQDPSKYGIMKGKLATGGESAGTIMVAAVSNELVKQNQSHHIIAQFMMDSWLQMIDVLYLPSYQKRGEIFPLSSELVSYVAAMVTLGNRNYRRIIQQYISGNVSRYFMCTPHWQYLGIPKTIDCETAPQINLDPKFVQAVSSPHLSPLLAETMQGVPQTFIGISEYDVCSSEAEVYASRLKKAGVRVVVEMFDETLHGGTIECFLQPELHLKTEVCKKALNIFNFFNSVFYNTGG